MAAPNYLTEAEYGERMKDFTGYIGHVNNQTKSDLRKDIVFSEERIKSELRTEIPSSEARLRDEIAVSNTKGDALDDAKVDSLIEGVRVLINLEIETHRLLQLVLDQLSAMRADRRRD